MRGSKVGKVAFVGSLLLLGGCGTADGSDVGQTGQGAAAATAGMTGTMVAAGGMIAAAMGGAGAVMAGAGPSNTAGGATGGAGAVAPPAQPLNNKLDLLFVIDNSISMSDKQSILQLAVPGLIDRLINPRCVDARGAVTQPVDATAPCPEGSQRELQPLMDLHIGIVTSSMGDGGAKEACQSSDVNPNSVQKVDNGYLLGSLPRAGVLQPPFLAWDGTDLPALQAGFEAQVAAAGEFGCGYEATLESWYHFLVDPIPWQSIDVVDCPGQAAGTEGCRDANIPVDAATGALGDPLILAQRAAFLRPDSAVAVVMLTDENDCSIIVGGTFNVVGKTSRRMFRASSICQTDPNDPCCYSCGSAAPEGCVADPICASDPMLPNADDEPNLRCWDQKRRFGVDFLYPIQRYVNALTAPTLGLCNVDLDPTGCETVNIATNPLFAGGRDPSRVLFAGIVGVPWQLIQATQAEDGAPYPQTELHFKTAAQLSTADQAGGPSAWDIIAGPPSVRDPHMLESIASVLTARPGLADSESAADADPIHGHEWVSLGSDDLQYACIFPLPEARDCDSDQFSNNQRGCDCRGAGDPSYTDNSPLCQSATGYSSVQYSAKAYPGLRHLDALRGFGDATGNAVVASICARNVTDQAAQDFGYNPAMSAIASRLRGMLAPP